MKSEAFRGFRSEPSIQTIKTMKTILLLVACLTGFSSPLGARDDALKFFATHPADWSRGHVWILPAPIRQGGERVAANYIRGIEILEVTVDGRRLEAQVAARWELDKMDEIIECTDGYFLFSAGPSLLSTLSRDADGTSRMLLFEILKIPDVIEIRYRKAGDAQEFLMESHADRTVRFYYEPEEDPTARTQKKDDG